MGPVTVAILATLLPTCLLIFGLVCLSTYLRVELRALSAKNKELQVRPLPKKGPWPRELPKIENPHPLSDASNPDWGQDALLVYSGLSAPWPRFIDSEDVFNWPGAESWAGRILEALGYQGASPAAILQLLRKKSTRIYVLSHLAISVGLGRTSFESEPESTLLPFSPEVQRDVRNCFKALEGMKFSPEFSSILSKIPVQIASEHGEINKENIEKITDLFQELLLPLIDIEHRGPNHCTFTKTARDMIREEFSVAVTLQLRMLGSRQQFEFRWDETSEKTICDSPTLYSHAGKDGVPLDEPKLWWKSITFDIEEGGSVSQRRA